MSRYQNPLEIMGLAAVVALGAAACSGSTNNTTTLLTNQQAAEVSAGVWLDVEGEVSEAASTGSVASYTDAPAAGTLGFAAPQCTVTRSPASPPDADADGVPDSVSLALNTCVLTYAPQETDTLLGTIVIKDPTPTTLDHNVQRTYQQVERIRERAAVGSTTPSRSTETWNGTRVMTRDSSALTQTETGFATNFALTDGTAPTHTRTWMSKFTADVAGSIVANQALPSGTWMISGSGTWTIGSSSFGVTLSTTTPLHYNTSCTATPRFDAGVLKAAITQGTGTGTVTITFTGCGSVSGVNS
jgi:hypothetical protein